MEKEQKVNLTNKRTRSRKLLREDQVHKRVGKPSAERSTSRGEGKQVLMVQEMQKDQKPEEVQISFSPYLKSRTDKAVVQTKKERFKIHDEQS